MRSRLLLTALLCGVLIGCGKPTVQSQPDTSNPPTQPVPPPAVTPPTPPVVSPPVVPPPVVPEPKPEPKPKSPNPLAGKVSTVDLTPYGLRAVIDLPEGAVFRPRQTSSFRVGYGETDKNSGYMDYDLDVAMNSFDFSEHKRLHRDGAKKIIADTDDRFYFDKTGYFGEHEMSRSFVLSGKQFLFTSRTTLPNYSPEAAEALWKAVESIRQTAAQQKVEGARNAALTKFKQGDREAAWNDLRNELVVTLEGDAITQENIRLLSDIPDLYTVRLVRFKPLNNELLTDILRMPTVRGVWLEGNWATDEVLALVTANARITDVTLVRADVTDKGFAKLEQLPKLRMVELQFCEKITPAATKSFRAKFPKLDFTNQR